MYNINTSILIKAPGRIVAQVLRDMSHYPRFMRYVKNIKVKKISDKEIISRWDIDIEGADVRWEERDIFDEYSMQMSFTMLQGDYSAYYGKWIVEPSGRKTRLSIDVYVDWDIPSFEKIIGPILKQKTEKIVRGMLASIRLYAQKVYQNEVTE